MLDTMNLQIVTPTAALVNGTAKSVRAPGREGEFEILPGHTVYISSLKPGEVCFDDGETQHYYAIGRGFAEVNDDVVLILTDSAEESSTLNAKDIEPLIVSDERRLDGMQSSDGEYAIISDRLERNRARLIVAARG